SQGSAVFNLQGEFLGLTSHANGQNALESQNDGDSTRNISACPAEVLHWDNARTRIVSLLQNGCEVEYGFLGVNTEDLTAAQIHPVNVTDGGAVRVVDDPVPGTPAAKASFRKGDIVVSVNGQRIRRVADLTWSVGAALAGSAIEFETLRDRRSTLIRVAELA